MAGLGAAAAAALIPAAPAGAVVEGYSPMTALKGKDYGKSRMTCASPQLASFATPKTACGVNGGAYRRPRVAVDARAAAPGDA